MGKLSILLALLVVLGSLNAANTTWTSAHGVAFTGSDGAGGGGVCGVNVSGGSSIIAGTIIANITRSAACTASTVNLTDNAGNVLKQGTFSGTKAAINYYINASTTYLIKPYSTGGWTFSYTTSTTAQTNNNITWNGNVGTCIDASLRFYCIESMDLIAPPPAAALAFVSPTPSDLAVVNTSNTFNASLTAAAGYYLNNASLYINGTQYYMGRYGTDPNYFFMISNLNLSDGQWSFFANATNTSNSSQFSTTETRTITVSSGRLTLCGSLSNTSSLNISMRDEQTGAHIPNGSINLYSVFPASSGTFSNTTSNISTCIDPPGANFQTNNTITASATGYYTRIINYATNVSNSSQTYYAYLLNSSVGYPMVLTLLQAPNIPITGVIINVYKYTPTNNYTQVESCTTSAGGSCTVHLVPNTQLYTYSFNVSGANYNYTETASCTGATCYRTFTIGSSGKPPYQITMSGICNFYSTTSTLQCNATDTNNVIRKMDLKVFVVGNNTAYCSQSAVSSTASLSCTLPAGRIYGYSFYGEDYTGYEYYLSSGNVDRTSLTGGYGRDGWMAVLVLGVVCALLFSNNLAISIGAMVVGMLLSMAIGLIPTTGNFVAVVGIGVLAFAMAYRLKV